MFFPVFFCVCIVCVPGVVFLLGYGFYGIGGDLLWLGLGFCGGGGLCMGLCFCRCVFPVLGFLFCYGFCCDRFGGFVGWFLKFARSLSVISAVDEVVVLV